MRQIVKGKGLYKAIYAFAFSFAVLGLSPAEDQSPTAQDVQIIGRVLSFQETALSGQVVLAIVYNPLDSKSLKEAKELSSLMGDSFTVGKIALKPLLVNQTQLALTTGFGAIFSTAGVDQGFLVPALKLHHVSCLTRHLDQVEQGICVVAICVLPTVSIVVNQANAMAAGVHFATAFRMMVREI